MAGSFSAGLLMVLETALERVLLGLFDVVHKGARDKKRRRELTRPGPLVERVSAELARGELSTAEEHEWRAAVDAVRESIEVSLPLRPEEALRVWRNTPDAEEYARSVLSGVDFGDRRVDVRGWHRIQFITHLQKLRHVRCVGDVNPLDPLGAMPSLHRLELWQNEVMRDLSPLTPSRSLKELHLHFSRVDLASLEGGALRRLRIRDSATDGGPDPLPSLPALRELAIDHRPPCPLAGLERWPAIRTLEVFGMPAADDLRASPVLEHLVVHQPDGWRNCAERCQA